MRLSLSLNGKIKSLAKAALILCVFKGQLYAAVSQAQLSCNLSAKPELQVFEDKVTGERLYSKLDLKDYDKDISTKQCFGICYVEAFAASVEKNIRIKSNGQYSIDRLSFILEALSNRYDNFEGNLHEPNPEKAQLRHIGISSYLNVYLAKKFQKPGDKKLQDFSSIYGGTSYSLFPYQKGDRLKVDVKARYNSYLVRAKDKADVEFEDNVLHEFSSKVVESERQFLEEELLVFHREYSKLAYQLPLQINTRALVKIEALQKLLMEKERLFSPIERSVLEDWFRLINRLENYSEAEQAKIVFSFLEIFPSISQKLINNYVFEFDSPTILEMNHYHTQLQSFFNDFQKASAKRLIPRFRRNLKELAESYQEKMLEHWRTKRQGESVHLLPLQASIEVELEASVAASRLLKDQNILQIEDALLNNKTVMLSFNYLEQNLHPPAVHAGFKNLKVTKNPNVPQSHYDQFVLGGNHMEEVLHVLRDTNSHEIKYLVLRGNHGFNASWSGKYLVDIDYFNQNYGSHDLVTVSKVDLKKKDKTLSELAKKAWQKLRSINW